MANLTTKCVFRNRICLRTEEYFCPFSSLINHSSTNRAKPIIIMLFHIGRTATGARRGVDVDLIHCYPFTCSINSLAGLNAGISWAGIMTVVFLEILRAVLLARCLMMKEPKPRRNTSSPSAMDVLSVSIKLSTIAITSFEGKPVLAAIYLTNSILVISVLFLNSKKECKVNALY